MSIAPSVSARMPAAPSLGLDGLVVVPGDVLSRALGRGIAISSSVEADAGSEEATAELKRTTEVALGHLLGGLHLETGEEIERSEFVHLFLRELVLLFILS